MKITRYLIYTVGSQSLLALALVTGISSEVVNITIYPVELIHMQGAPPLFELNKRISEDIPLSDSLENLCTIVLRKSGIPADYKLQFFEIPAPGNID